MSRNSSSKWYESYLQFFSICNYLLLFLGLDPSPIKRQETKAEMTDDDDTAQGYVDDTGGITISESAVLNLDDNAIMLI